jgi:hypothetical protein
VQSLAFSPDGQRLALGRYDGSLAFWETASRKQGLVLRQSPGTVPHGQPPQLVRNASLDPPSPRGGVRGSRIRVALGGRSAGHATQVIIPEPGLSATIVPPSKPDENRLEIDLTIAPDARVGLHAIGIMTPLGVPGFQTFAVDAAPEVSEIEPNDQPDSIKGKTAALPATLLGAIERPGDIDLFAIEVKPGQELVFQVVARALGSQLRPLLAVLEPNGNVLAQSDAGSSAVDPVLTYTTRQSGLVYLRIADADFGGSGSHFYRIAAGRFAYVSSVFPLGVERGKTARVEVNGANLERTSEATFPVAAETAAGTIIGVPVALPGGKHPFQSRNVVVADGPQLVEQETNDTGSQAQELAVPGGASGFIGQPGDVDFYRFPARKGERLIVEVYGRRLGSPIDSVIAILNASGSPVPRAVLRPVDQTEVAFRDHPSTGAGVRLTRWNNLAINDYLLVGRELTRIQALPRNPDDDCVLWNQGGQRLGMLETTPEHHPLGQPMYKVEIHPPATVFPLGGVAPVTLTYNNDDGGPSFQKDSRVTFDPPADGVYLVRVADVRGLGGADHAYHLVVRRPSPSFRIDLGTENPNVPRGGTELVAVNVTRTDGFDSPIEVRAEDLPPGITATPAKIDGGELSGFLALSADAQAPAFSPPTWRVIAQAAPSEEKSRTPSPKPLQIDPGGPSGGWITVTPPSNLRISARPQRLLIQPGQQVSMTLSVDRSPAFSGRVPIEVKNLPQGVRVLNIGLNGVLITEKQAERTVFLLAEPWASPMVRPFYAVGRAESAGTEDSSLPIELVVGGAATRP